MRVDVVHNVLKLNDALAAQIRSRLHERGIFTLNLISAPGSGKTTLLERTLAHFGERLGQAVIVGDLATSRDAERLAQFARCVQINTDGGCHLDAAMVANALDTLDLDGVEVLYIENVGNLVCPVGFDLGHDAKVGVISVTEGEDKVAKYPRLWREADVVLLNKIDLLPYVPFDRDRFYADLRDINGTVPVIEVAAAKGEGLEAWFAWVAERAQKANGE
jgi:hydrogenase nickel incorporation protein HypB